MSDKLREGIARIIREECGHHSDFTGRAAASILALIPAHPSAQAVSELVEAAKNVVTLPDRLAQHDLDRLSRALAAVGGQVMATDRKIHWRCFHCGEAFTKAQERWAREHFGRDEGELPVCQMRIPGEHHLLTALRKAQDELARFYAEDQDLMRAIYAMSADHAQALRREEERGYEKGLADGRGLAAVGSPHPPAEAT